MQIKSLDSVRLDEPAVNVDLGHLLHVWLPDVAMAPSIDLANVHDNLHDDS
jgi:hypothetical protein